MKLIIEIPIDLLERTKSGDYNFGDDLARNEVIVNGTPYNPTGDCISREALTEEMRKSINERYPKWDKPITVADIATLIFDVIDNAQAIPLPNEQIAWEQGYEAGLAQGKHDRPQGEWIIVKDEKYGDNVKCPFCGKELAGTDLNFCVKCGADMKGGAE